MPERWAKFGEQHESDLESIFNGAENVAEFARRKAKEQAYSPTDKIGPRFERAVARRVQSWLKEHGSTFPINEAWLNVKVRYLADPASDLAEFDITLVLSNGILLVLECKSFDAKQSELDGRLLRLQQHTTRLSRLRVCVPLYTAFQDRSWFDTSHKVAQAARPYMGFVAFTLNDQLAAYRDPSDTRDITAPPFEEALRELVKPYCPQHG